MASPEALGQKTTLRGNNGGTEKRNETEMETRRIACAGGGGM